MPKKAKMSSNFGRFCYLAVANQNLQGPGLRTHTGLNSLLMSPPPRRGFVTQDGRTILISSNILSYVNASNHLSSHWSSDHINSYHIIRPPRFQITRGHVVRSLRHSGRSGGSETSPNSILHWARQVVSSPDWFALSETLQLCCNLICNRSGDGHTKSV